MPKGSKRTKRKKNLIMQDVWHAPSSDELTVEQKLDYATKALWRIDHVMRGPLMSRDEVYYAFRQIRLQLDLITPLWVGKAHLFV